MDSEELQDAYGPSASFRVDGDKVITYAHNSGPNVIAGTLTCIDPSKPINSYELVREFMETFGHSLPEGNEPVVEDEYWEKLRLELIREEFCELLYSCGYGDSASLIENVDLIKEEPTDVVDAADALGDLEYVINGTALRMNINLPAVVKEIHRSNMTKLGRDGRPVVREDGKILKGEDYEPPDIEGVLFDK